MKRPVLVWLAFAACAAVGLGVLGWFTSEMLRFEGAAAETRRLAAREENIRLALWRMDSALATVHGLEAARPWHDYEPFHGLEAAYSRDLAPLPAGTVWAPSPLLQFRPPFVRLHFQVEPDGTIRSPEAPPARFRPAAVAAGVPATALDEAQDTLEALRRAVNPGQLLARVDAISSGALASTEEDRPGKAEAAPTDNANDARAATAPTEAPAAPAPQTLPVQQQVKNVAEQRQREELYAQQSTLNLPAARRAQEYAEGNEAAFRLDRASSSSLRKASPAAAPPAATPTRELAAAGAAETPAAADERRATMEAERPSGRRTWSLADAVGPAPAAQTATAAAAAEAKAEPEAPSTIEGPLQAMWTGGELVLVRRAALADRVVAQGAWLDWPELEAWLLGRITDLLPEARLAAIPGAPPRDGASSARRLAFLPVQLFPGTTLPAEADAWSPLRTSLAAAWVSAVLGAGALALLLRGTLRLSERRGAFVSAVTHELRTPLTTFRIYTEMLSSGMVADEAKRRSYLDTLRKESERLAHLVDNVLSYSRIERGRAASRVEETTPGNLLTRIEDRLRQRLEQVGMPLRVDLADADASRPLRTDTTAVEQVLFNLVDNAAKYGRPADGSGGEVVLRVNRHDRGGVSFRVSDNGPGIPPAVRTRLFQPFSKSAVEAAGSQPGVGLGLALCRRLARKELRGDLVLERTGPDGTTFRLDVPAAAGPALKAPKTPSR